MVSSIEVSQTDVNSIKFLLVGIKNGVPRVLSNSINKSIKTSQVQAVKLTGQEISLTAKRIKEDFRQEKANFSRLRGALHATGDPVGLINFQARQVKKGVTQKVKRQASRSLVPGAYISVGKPVRTPTGTNKVHVFRREYRKKNTPMPVKLGRSYAKLPIDYKSPTSRLTGPRIEDIYGKPGIYDKVVKIALDAYALNVVNETASLLRRYG